MPRKTNKEDKEKSVVVGLYLPLSLYAQLKRRAALEDRTVSAYIRRVLTRATEQNEEK